MYCIDDLMIRVVIDYSLKILKTNCVDEGPLKPPGKLQVLSKLWDGKSHHTANL